MRTAPVVPCNTPAWEADRSITSVRIPSRITEWRWQVFGILELAAVFRRRDNGAVGFHRFVGGGSLALLSWL